MTPEEAHTLAAIVEAVDDAGCTVHDVAVEHHRVPRGLLNLTGGKRRARYSVVIDVEPSKVLEDESPDTGATGAGEQDIQKAIDGVEISLDDDDDDDDDREQNVATDGAGIVEDKLPDHLTKVQTLGGAPLLRCLRCGREGATHENLDHRAGCPAPTGGCD